MVVVQSGERLLPTPEIRGSNPGISIILSTNFTIKKTKIKKKRPGMAHLLMRIHHFIGGGTDPIKLLGKLCCEYLSEYLLK